MADTVDVLKLMENVVFLKKYTLFSELHTDELRTLALIAREVDVKDGDCVVRENDAGDTFFFLKRGGLRVVKGEGAAAAELSRLAPGGCIGEMALIEEGLLRSASVFAAGASTVLMFQRDDLFDAMGKHPGIALELLKLFGGRLRDANQKMQTLMKEKESHP